MREVLGEINWIAVSSGPDISAAVSLLQQKVNRAQVQDLIGVNKLVGVVRDFSHVMMRVLPIPPEKLAWTVWSDASWANAEDLKSQGGYFVAATERVIGHGKWSAVSPTRWKSFKQDRQVASTLAAELVTLSRALAEVSWFRSLWCEAEFGNYQLQNDAVFSAKVPVVAAIDSEPVFDHVGSEVVSVKDKRVAIEMLLVKNDVRTKGMSLKWIPTYPMLGACLTKESAPRQFLLRVLAESRYKMTKDPEIKAWTRLRRFQEEAMR